MSREEAEREKQMKEQEALVQQENERVSSWRSSSSRRLSSCIAIPPMPSHQPPPVPSSSGNLSPQAQGALEKAQHTANKSEEQGANEEVLPDKTLRTVPAPSERRESGHSQPSILPVVEEATEAHSTKGHSRGGNHYNQPMPHTVSGLRDQRTNRTAEQHPPPTPPKNDLKTESQDSGYGTLSQGIGDDGGAVHASMAPPRLSKDSLNKELPPLPTEVGT